MNTVNLVTLPHECAACAGGIFKQEMGCTFVEYLTGFA